MLSTFLHSCDVRKLPQEKAITGTVGWSANTCQGEADDHGWQFLTCIEHSLALLECIVLAISPVLANILGLAKALIH